MAGQRLLTSAAEAVAWLRARVAATAELRTDSRQVAPGEAFIAWPGYAHDGRAFVAAALAAGAAACLVEADGLEAWIVARATEAAKCVRCWHYRADVGRHADHPELCGRCVENVDGAGEDRRHF